MFREINFGAKAALLRAKEPHVNYFRVQSALIAGVQAIPITVESAQSRRLPYLQILEEAGRPRRS